MPKRKSGHQRKLTHGVLYKIINVNLFIFACFAILLFFTNIYFRKLINNQIDEYQSKELFSIINTVNDQIEESHFILYQYRYNFTSLSVTHLESDISSYVALQFAGLQKDIQQLRSHKSDLADIFVYYRNIDRIIYSAGSCTSAIFFRDVLNNQNKELKQFIRALDVDGTITLTSAAYKEGIYKNEFNVNLFIYPFRDIVLMLALSTNAVTNTLQEYISLKDTMFFVLNKSGVIYSSNFPQLKKIDSEKLIHEITNSNQSVLSFDGQSYKLNRKITNEYEMTFFHMINRDNIYTRLSRITIFMLYLLLGILVFEFLIFLFMNHEFYSPLRDILSRYKLRKGTDYKNEYEIIKNKMGSMQENIQQLEDARIEREGIVEEYLVNKLLIEYSSVVKINSTGQQRQAYIVLLILLENENGKLNISAIQEIEGKLKHRFRVIKIHTGSEEQAYLINFEEDHDYKGYILDVFQQARSTGGFAVAGVSSKHNTINDVRMALNESIEALNGCDRDRSWEKMKIGFFDSDNEIDQDEFQLTIEQEAHLVNYLMMGNTDEIRNSLELIGKRNSNKSYRQQKRLYQYIFHLLVVVANKKYDSIHEIIPVEHRHLIYGDKEIYYLKRLKEAVVACFSIVGLKAAREKVSLASEIKAYIDECYYLRDFSLDCMSATRAFVALRIVSAS